MIDIKFLRENPDVVRENIKKKFQDAKLPLVDEVIALDVEKRQTQQKADSLRASRNKLSKQIGALMGQGKRDEAEQVKAQVKAQSDELLAAEAKEKELDERILKIMMTIPNIIDPSVPIGRDDSATASRSRRTSRCRTTPRSWSASTASTSTPRAALRATASTT